MKDNFYQIAIANRFRFSEIVPVQTGYERCPPGLTPHSTPLNVLIHYIHEGNGTIKVSDKIYSLKSGQAFVTFPCQKPYHTSDEKDPWFYSWIEMRGASVPEFLNAAGFTKSWPVINDMQSKPMEKAFCDIIKASKEKNFSYQKIVSLTWNLIDVILNLDTITPIKTPQSESYINQAISYIHSSPITALSVNSLAKYVGLDRSYLSSLFKRHLNVTPKEYITNYKMNLAKTLLLNPTLNTDNIAEMLGFSDAGTFLRAFKIYHGANAATWKAQDKNMH